MKWQMKQILELHLFYSLKGVEAYHKKDVEIDKHPKPLFRKRGLFQFLQSALVTKKRLPYRYCLQNLPEWTLEKALRKN